MIGTTVFKVEVRSEPAEPAKAKIAFLSVAMAPARQVAWCNALRLPSHQSGRTPSFANPDCIGGADTWHIGIGAKMWLLLLPLKLR